MAPTYLLPTDIMIQIFKLLPIEYAYNTLLAGIDCKEAYDTRIDPREIFRQITPEPTSLMIMMLLSDTVLCGNIPLMHFLPGVKIPDAKWEFVTSRSSIHSFTFITYMIVAGLVIEKDERNIVTGKMNGHNITIKSPISLLNATSSGNPTLRVISDHKRSCDKCMITGYGIISPDSYVVKHYLITEAADATGVRLITDDIPNGMQRAGSVKNCVKLFSNVPMLPGREFKVRYIGDNDSFVSLFNLSRYNMTFFTFARLQLLDNINTTIWTESVFGCAMERIDARFHNSFDEPPDEHVYVKSLKANSLDHYRYMRFKERHLLTPNVLVYSRKLLLIAMMTHLEIISSKRVVLDMTFDISPLSYENLFIVYNDATTMLTRSTVPAIRIELNDMKYIFDDNLEYKKLDNSRYEVLRHEMKYHGAMMTYLKGCPQRVLLLALKAFK